MKFQRIESELEHISWLSKKRPQSHLSTEEWIVSVLIEVILSEESLELLWNTMYSYRVYLKYLGFHLVLDLSQACSVGDGGLIILNISGMSRKTIPTLVGYKIRRVN